MKLQAKLGQLKMMQGRMSTVLLTQGNPTPELGLSMRKETLGHCFALGEAAKPPWVFQEWRIQPGLGGKWGNAAPAPPLPLGSFSCSSLPIPARTFHGSPAALGTPSPQLLVFGTPRSAMWSLVPSPAVLRQKYISCLEKERAQASNSSFSGFSPFLKVL